MGVLPVKDPDWRAAVQPDGATDLRMSKLGRTIDGPMLSPFHELFFWKDSKSNVAEVICHSAVLKFTDGLSNRWVRTFLVALA